MPFQKKSGFTLIEMLVVIAIVAVLVSVIIPIIDSSLEKAEATTDAANLRTVVGELNIVLVGDNILAQDAVEKIEATESKMNPDAKLMVLYRYPGFIAPYYVTEDGKYYGLDYLTEVATTGESSLSLAPPAAQADDQWFTLSTVKEAE